MNRSGMYMYVCIYIYIYIYMRRPGRSPQPSEGRPEAAADPAGAALTSASVLMTTNLIVCY